MNVTPVTPEARSQAGTVLSENTAALNDHAAPLEGEALITFIVANLDDGKAEDILTIDLLGKSSFADAMIIASGRSNRQVAALSDRLTRAAKNHGMNRLAVEGLPQADWVLIDFGEVIVHLFRPEVRSFYNLEKMWSEPGTSATA
ncbi:MAG: ribosome silencing factor [Pseudomonadota bacterium]